MFQTKQVPTITEVGNLKTIVHESGHNNDDGDGFSVKADDALKPPAQLPLGVVSIVSSFLFRS